MKNLLDTHAFLWFFDDNDRLSQNAKNAILNAHNENFISIVSVWELAIKISIKKYSFDGGLDALIKTIRKNNFIVLETIKDDYLKILQNLPFFHKDPFDRIIVATAIFENMTIITIDDNIKLYDVKTLW